jgi:hypothetical protein
MSLLRVMCVLVALGGVGVLAVALRAEQLRTTSRIEQLRLERVSLRRELWDAQLSIARLRSPEPIRDRVARWFPATDDAAPLENPDSARRGPTGGSTGGREAGSLVNAGLAPR